MVARARPSPRTPPAGPLGPRGARGRAPASPRPGVPEVLALSLALLDVRRPGVLRADRDRPPQPDRRHGRDRDPRHELRGGGDPVAGVRGAERRGHQRCRCERRPGRLRELPSIPAPRISSARRPARSTASDAIRVCDLFDKPLAISFWFTKGGDCTPSQDAFDAVSRRYGDRVNFLSMNVRDSRETVNQIVEAGGWEVPVGLDPDGAVSNLYRVGGCPTIVLAYPGGILYRAEIGQRLRG